MPAITSQRYYLSSNVMLRWLEEPSVYHVKNDELYEVDRKGFEFLKRCASGKDYYGDDREFISYCISEDILSEISQDKVKQRIRKSHISSLRYLELLITDRCNLQCKHCYIGEPQIRELPVDQIVSVLEEFNKIQGLKVLLSGGEPLLHKDFSEINEYLSEYPLRKSLLSNGLLLNNATLKSLNVDDIQISIDGFEAAHDALRGKGSYKRATKAIECAIKNGFDISVSTMIHPGNLNEFDGLERLFRDIGVKEWTVDVPCLSGRMKENDDLYLSPEVAGRFLKYGYGEGLHSGGEGYTCGLHLVSVLPDGYVAKCAFYADRPVGHILEGLERCWKRVKPLRLVELKCDCEKIEICRGGCRYRAEIMGDPLGKDRYRCVDFIGN